MGFGPEWGPGKHDEFEIIDFGYNSADTSVRRALRARLAAWDPSDPDRESVHQMQNATVLNNLYQRVASQPSVPVPAILADLYEKANQGRTPAAAEAWFNEIIQRKTAEIELSWFRRDGGASQWIHDSRRRPAEIQAIMIRAKLEICDLLLSGRAKRCRSLGQCEWPEFSVRVALDDNKTAEVWVYGPDNGMAEDPVRQNAPRLLGTPDPLRGQLAVSSLSDAVPDVSSSIARAGQRVPYVAAGPRRAVTEIRWQPSAVAPAGPSPSPAPGSTTADNRGPLLRLPGPIPDQGIWRLLPELEKVQGNILRSHGRPHAAYLLLHFNDPDAARAYLAGLPVTTAARQRAEAHRVNHEGEPGDTPFIGLGLSAAGYRALGRPQALPPDRLFRLGMRDERSVALTGDPAVSTWEAGYRGSIHAVLILAHQDPAALTQLVAAHRARWSGAAGQITIELVATEIGSVIKNSNDQPIEPFGFADNLSQPLFFEEHVDRKLDGVTVYDRATGQDRPVTDGENGWPLGFAPHHVLVPDGDDGTLGYGSYLVFRKLEQDLPRFHQLQADLATTLGVAPGQAGGQLVGRAPDGMPALDPLDPQVPRLAETEAAQRGDFTYQPQSGCPFAAHTRRMNDRTERGRRRVMARRGIPYNEHNQWATTPPDPTLTSGVGLLFQACVWDVQDQFADLQREAVRPTDHGSPDPLLGAGRRWWADPTGRRPSVELSLGNDPLVRLRGGEYFFLPSPAFLAGLNDATAP